ncbi:hypothetical protein [Herbiconiux sp.]|jgi:hypothetical protein|uniref:hypothetical protein n=1 Tax=Herbiconiux sp. TaxID=1871186 RepID=UPI0025B8F03B|nr:hypothetical protein [Herbiconiux sp.]
MPIVVTVNRDQFILRDPEAVSRVRAEIEAAVRAGGRLVSVGDTAAGPEVLITPATHVRIDILTDSADGLHEAADFIDFDHYGPTAA